MSTPGFTGLNVKRSSRTKASAVWRLVFEVIGRVASLRVRWWLSLGLAPIVVLLAWPDPHRVERLRKQADEALARETAAQSTPSVTDGIAEISFRWLSFPLTKDDTSARAAEPSYGPLVPGRIREFDGSRIRIRGFMLPTLNEGAGVREFMILPSPMTCCYGVAPRFCEFITAHVKGNAIPACMDEPVTFEGTLHVGDIYVNGYWSALYTMDCTNVAR